jgi:hypothetical protein
MRATDVMQRMQVTSSCRRSVAPLLRDTVLHLSRTSSISTSASVSREPSVSRSLAMEPHRVMSLLFDDSVLNPISVGICTDRKAPIGSSKNVALISRLKVLAFDNCVPNGRNACEGRCFAAGNCISQALGC